MIYYFTTFYLKLHYVLPHIVRFVHHQLQHLEDVHDHGYYHHDDRVRDPDEDDHVHDHVHDHHVGDKHVHYHLHDHVHDMNMIVIIE